jgi:hypothetical protein
MANITAAMPEQFKEARVSSGAENHISSQTTCTEWTFVAQDSRPPFFDISDLLIPNELTPLVPMQENSVTLFAELEPLCCHSPKGFQH